jgi:hypothetical protein
MSYWLHGLSSDDPSPPSGHDVVIMAVDPDMVFLHNLFVSQDDDNENRDSDGSDNILHMVRPGHGVAARYAIGNDWLKKKRWNRFWCYEEEKNENGRCAVPAIPDEPSSRYSFGHPLIFTADDAKRHADLWINVTNDLRRVDRGWQTEMYSNVITAYRVDIQMTIFDMMISRPTEPEEQLGWEVLKWNPPYSSSKMTFIAHYCDQYRVADFKFDKRGGQFKNIDLQSCGDNLHLTPPDDLTKKIMSNQEGNEAYLHQNIEEDEGNNIFVTRNVWMIDIAFDTSKKAIEAYYDEFC